jgi:hypothetical protein
VQSQAQAQQQVQDEIGGMHDEADIMSFRSAATQRFLLNQELIENITDKWIHVDNILKPKPFANVRTTETQIHEIKDELYFGNLELMKQKVALLEEQILELNSAPTIGEDFEDNEFLCEQINQLSQAYESNSRVDIPAVESTFTEKLKNTLTSERYRVKKLPKINSDHREAPSNYWEELRRAKEEVLQRSNVPPQPELLVPQGFSMPDDAISAQDPMAGFRQPVFENADLNMMDDAFGQYSNLDDNDFLSQIDHSMEP